MTIYSLDILLSNFEPVHCSMSSSNYCFLTCVQISQEAGKVVWYSHLLKNFLQFVVIHSQRLLHSEWSRCFFLEFCCFFNDPMNLGNLICGSSAFSKFNLNIWKFTYCWSLASRILSITSLVCEMSETVQFWTFFGIAFLWDWNENWPFPVLWPLLSFPNLLAD